MTSPLPVGPLGNLRLTMKAWNQSIGSVSWTCCLLICPFGSASAHMHRALMILIEKNYETSLQVVPQYAVCTLERICAQKAFLRMFDNGHFGRILNACI